MNLHDIGKEPERVFDAANPYFNLTEAQWRAVSGAASPSAYYNNFMRDIGARDSNPTVYMMDSVGIGVVDGDPLSAAPNIRTQRLGEAILENIHRFRATLLRAGYRDAEMRKMAFFITPQEYEALMNEFHRRMSQYGLDWEGRNGNLVVMGVNVRVE